MATKGWFRKVWKQWLDHKWIKECCHPLDLTNPPAWEVVDLEFFVISHRGKKLPPAAVELGEFLKRYIAQWAGHAGAL
jgi:hypothetical protein